MKQAVFALLIGCIPGLLPAQTLRLNAVRGLPFQEGMRAVVSGGGACVAVGEAGAIYSSLDGLSWTRRETTIRADLQAAVWNGSLFCIAGNDGAILTSPDGVSWTVRTSGTAINLGATASGNGLILVAGDAGRIFTSPDGVAWTPRVTPSIERINGLAFGSGTFVAVTEAGGILTSPDAATWTAQTSPASGALASVAFGSGLFTAVGAGGEVLTSPDGIAWTVRRSGQMERLWCATATSSGFASCGSGGVVLTSSDGLTWTSGTISGNPRLRSLTEGPSILIAVSDMGQMWTSADGSAWTPRSTGGDDGLAAVATNGTNTFVAVGAGGAILTSADGANWNAAASPTTDDLEGIVFGGSKFVAVGAHGSILSSTDAVSWAAVASGTTVSLKAITHGTGSFVAVGQGGLVLRSTDGSTWNATTVPGAKGDLLAVAYGNGLFIAVGQWGQIATSPDGVSWTLLPDDPAQKERWYDITGIAFANGRFVTSTHFATSFTSTDGINWTKRTAAMVPGRDFHGAVALGGSFAVFGDDGTIHLSTDGAAWSDISRATGTRLRGAALNGNIAVFVGDNGAVVQAAMLNRQTNWTTYHDTITQADNAANVTTGDPTTNTALLDFSTGTTIPGVAIRFSKTIGTSGALKTDANTGNPVLGGDAATLFGGIIGFGTQVWDLGKNTGTATITISGLSPEKVYDLSIFGTRDNFSSQTKLTLGGAASFAASHSAGYLSIGGSPSGAEVAIATGDGSTAAGRVARWSDIIATGTVLTITVTSPAPASFSCILPQAIRLVEMTESPVILAGPVSVVASAGDSVELTSSVVGTGVSLQWYRRDILGNVSAITSATSSSFVIQNLAESSQYFVQATASGGSVDSSSATVIARRTYDQWAALNSLPASDEDGDTDGDGLLNLVEYSLGTNPASSATGQAPVFAINNSNRLALTFRVSREIEGVTITPEASATLASGSWESASVVLQQLADENFATETWEASVPFVGSRAFLRLHVTRQ